MTAGITETMREGVALKAETTHGAGGRMETFEYDDKIVRYFAVATVAWGIVAFLAGLIVALLLVLPTIAAKVPWIGAMISIPYLSFGRLRPLHTNAAIFAFAGNAIFAGIYYSTQRLLKTRMWSDKFSWLHFWGWQLIIVSAAVTLPLGITQGKEYAELEWPIDIMIAVVWVGFFATNFFMTLKVRRERHIYVAIWFYIATIVAVTVLHVFNSLALPVSLTKSYSIYAGVQDAFMQWWYGHNAVAFFLTTPFLGLMYYFVPKAADRPVYSYRLSIVHFWSLVFIYIWAGPHHLHYTALPEWASTLGMVFSVMLWMPSWGGMINGLFTLRGAWHKVSQDPVLKFFVVGITFYGMATFEGPLLSIKSVNALSHYTDWTIAHVHSGALGWNGFITFGMLYWMMPRLFQTKLYSQKLANTHFWLGTIGILLYIIAIYTAGLTQGLMWRAVDETGHLQYGQFIETTWVLIPMYIIRVVGGLMFLLGAGLMAWNFFMTWQKRPATYAPSVATAPALERAYVEPLPAKGRLDDEHTVLEVGKKIDRLMQGRWHRAWEGKAMVFTMWTIAAVLAASAFEMVPMFLIRSNVPTIASVQPYSPLELMGRDIYVSEGCYNCHSQMVRPILPETKRYNNVYSKAGEFVYDHPFQWGSRRIGPDLAQEGNMKSNLAWHYQHFKNPQAVTPGSVMPRYAWLYETQADFSGIQPRVNAMYNLGVPYIKEVLADAEGVAKAQGKRLALDMARQALDEEKGPDAEKKVQALAASLEDKQVIALTAYVLRLGKDAGAAWPTDVKEQDRLRAAMQKGEAVGK
jgi:cytochrome c oxidase cbb3-type subunit I/II